MYTCPKDDIHSIYLDQELPEPYCSQYVEHLKECPECSKKLSSLKAIRQAVASSADNIHFSQEELDQSYARLQARLSYSKITQKKPKIRFGARTRNFLGYIATGVAAAAAVAVILPNTRSNPSYQMADFTPVSRTAVYAPVSTVANKGTNISPSSLASFFSQDIDSQAERSLKVSTAATIPGQNVTYDFAGYDIFTVYPEKPLAGSSYGTLPLDEFSQDIFNTLLQMELNMYLQQAIYGVGSDIFSLPGLLLNLNPSYNYINYTDTLTGN